MKRRDIFTIYRKELRDTLRDRRTILTMFVLPTMIIPLIVFSFSFAATRVIDSARAEIPGVMLLGAANSPDVREALQANDRIRLVPASDDYVTLIADKAVRAAVDVPDDFDAAVARGEPTRVRIYHYEGEIKSGFGVSELERFFREYRERTVAARLTERNLPQSLITPFAVTRENVAPLEKVGGNIVGGFIPYIVILLCFTGAMYPAMDLTAGEKERGTMETLLCAPVARIDIVLGKFLMVLTGSLSTVVLAGVSASIAIPLGSRLLDGPGESAGGSALPLIDPLGLAASLVLVLPVAVLFSAVVFTLALYARSQKEAQSLISPLIVVVLLPALAGLLPGVELGFPLALVPLLNVSLASKELVSGVYPWGYLLLIFGSTCLYAAAALGIAVRLFNRESVIFRV